MNRLLCLGTHDLVRAQEAQMARTVGVQVTRLTEAKDRDRVTAAAHLARRLQPRHLRRVHLHRDHQGACLAFNGCIARHGTVGGD